MPLPLIFDAVCRAVGGELSADDNREYLLFMPTDGSGSADAVENGAPIKILVDDVGQQSLFTTGVSYRFSINVVP